MYRKKFGRIHPQNIVDFLVIDPEFPRSVHYCIQCADESLHAITGTPSGAFRSPSERLLGLLRAELDYTSIEQVVRAGLHEYLDTLQMKMNAVDNGLVEEFFARGAFEQMQSMESGR
jgi:uncharacterized alpha-E superfamily protein